MPVTKRFAVIGATFLMLASCMHADEQMKGEVITKLTSQSGIATAYLTRYSAGGAAVGAAHWVYLRGPSGDQSGSVLLEAANTCNFQLAWKSAEVLQIDYEGHQCNIMKFRNYWHNPLIVQSGEVAPRIELVLIRHP
jgi:hypothetical protein